MQAPAGMGLENVLKEGGQTQEATRYGSIATKCLQWGNPQGLMQIGGGRLGAGGGGEGRKVTTMPGDGFQASGRADGRKEPKLPAASPGA